MKLSSYLGEAEDGETGSSLDGSPLGHLGHLGQGLPPVRLSSCLPDLGGGLALLLPLLAVTAIPRPPAPLMAPRQLLAGPQLVPHPPEGNFFYTHPGPNVLTAYYQG